MGCPGVELISRCQPDLAIVDIGLPKLDGYGVATEVRKRLGKGHIRLVAVSGFGQEADRKRSLEVGFDEHLVKPVDVDSILSLLARPARPDARPGVSGSSRRSAATGFADSYQRRCPNPIRSPAMRAVLEGKHRLAYKCSRVQ